MFCERDGIKNVHSAIRQIKDPFIQAFWAEEYANYDPRFQREAIAPIQNKLGQFLLNPVIRNILGQVKTKVSIPFTMNNGRIFIANLSKDSGDHLQFATGQKVAVLAN